MMVEQSVKKSSPLTIALAWAIVVIPLGWGFSYTVQNAMKLFTARSVTTAPAAK